MAKLTECEKRELLRLASSKSLRKDCERLSRDRFRLPLGSDGEVDADKYGQFCAEFNSMINHEPRPFRRIDDHDMRM